MCSNVDDFNNRNLFLTAKLLKQGYKFHKIRKAFSKFYHRHSELIVKYNIGLKTLLQQGISEPIFYGDLVYKFKRIVGKPIFVPRLFEEKRRDIVFGIPSFRPSVLPSFRPPNIVGTLCAQLLLQFYADSFETLQMF